MEVPKHYSQFVDEYGGITEFGLPRFKLWWGSTEHPDMALPAEFFGPYLQCFCLLEWRPASDFGLPEEWPEGFGPYPSRGGYLPLQIFKDPETNIPSRLDSQTLNKNVLGMFMALHLRHEHDSMQERRRTMRDLRESREEAELKRLAERLSDAVPQFGDAASFSGQKNCTTALKQKMDKIERNIDRIRDFRRRFPRGPSIRGAQPGENRIITI